MSRTTSVIKTHCLAMDGKPQSTGILWLPLLEFEYLPDLKLDTMTLWKSSIR